MLYQLITTINSEQHNKHHSLETTIPQTIFITIILTDVLQLTTSHHTHLQAPQSLPSNIDNYRPSQTKNMINNRQG